MSTTTISVAITVGATTYRIEEVGDPTDVMFAMQVGRAVSLAMMKHEE